MFDQISLYADPENSGGATTTPLVLNEDTKDVATLTASTGPTILYPSGAVTLAGGPQPQETFTSGDLAGDTFSTNVPGRNPYILQILDAVKNTLLYALNYLRPFGGIQANQYVD